MFDKVVMTIAWLIIAIPIAYGVLLFVLAFLGIPKVRAWTIGVLGFFFLLGSGQLSCDSPVEYDCPNTYIQTC